MPKGQTWEPELRERVLEMRAQGHTYAEIVAALGVSRSAAAEWCATDSQQERAMARRASYGGSCRECGARTWGGRGPSKPPRICFACLRAGQKLTPAERRRKRREQMRAYVAEGRQSILRARQRAAQRLTEEKKAAYLAVHRALRAGQLIRPSRCERCGGRDEFGARNAFIHAHHPDYSKPLDVEWLCAVCHREHHPWGGAR